MAVITTAQYKTYAGISGTASDGALDVIIPAAQALAEKWCGYAFDTGTRTERYSGPIDSNSIRLKGYPVTSITSVRRYYGAGASDYDTVDSTSYTYEATTSTLYLPGTGRGGEIMTRDDWGLLVEGDLGASPRFVEGLNNYQVVYVSGYSSMPADLQYAMYKLVDAMFADRRDNPMYKSASVRDASYTKFDNSPTVGALVTQLFSAYRVGGP